MKCELELSAYLIRISRRLRNLDCLICINEVTTNYLGTIILGTNYLGINNKRLTTKYHTIHCSKIIIKHGILLVNIQYMMKISMIKLLNLHA